MAGAVELIREYGFPDLRIKEIVERAGLSVGTFYLYFESKADLFVVLVTECTERLRDRLAQAYATAGPVTERLARGLDVYLDFVEENEKGFLYFTRAADDLSTSAGRLSTWAFSAHAATLKPLIEEAIAAGAVIPLDPELTAQALVGLTQHMAAYWLEHRDAYSREDLRRFLIAATAASLAR